MSDRRIITVRMGPSFAKRCEKIMKNDNVYWHEWRTVSGKVFQSAAYRVTLTDTKWIDVTDNFQEVQDLYESQPAKLYSFALVGNNLKSWSKGTLKRIKVVFCILE